MPKTRKDPLKLNPSTFIKRKVKLDADNEPIMHPEKKDVPMTRSTWSLYTHGVTIDENGKKNYKATKYRQELMINKETGQPYLNEEGKPYTRGAWYGKQKRERDKKELEERNSLLEEVADLPASLILNEPVQENTPKKRKYYRKDDEEMHRSTKYKRKPKKINGEIVIDPETGEPISQSVWSLYKNGITISEDGEKIYHATKFRQQEITNPRTNKKSTLGAFYRGEQRIREEEREREKEKQQDSISSTAPRPPENLDALAPAMTTHELNLSETTAVNTEANLTPQNNYSMGFFSPISAIGSQSSEPNVANLTFTEDELQAIYAELANKLTGG